MQKAFVNALKAMMFVLLMASAALAIESPHTASLGCTGCHSPLGSSSYTFDMSTTMGVNNLCLSCHNPALMDKAFTTKDMANPFGSTAMGVYTSGRMQTSHNWAAPVNVPAAGAATPVDPIMRALKATQAGIISCASCHDHHGAAGGNLLRQPSNSDLLCFDCHRSRNQRNHLSGTHPVNFNYTSATSKVKQKPAEYLATPTNANPANPTSAMKLPGGKLICTTCHGIHFSDSNSQTFDNHSSSYLGKLTPSQGYLLRTDMRGEAANAVNICTNCHNNKTAHNNKGQNIQCADCHAGHVDPGDGTAPNVWLVRRYMNYSGGVKLDSYRTKVLYQSVGSQSNWAGTYGVCQGCHNVPVGGIYPPEHTSANPDVCRSCHGHGSAIGSFSADCNGCHGFAPALNAPGPNGYASNYITSGVFKDESKTPHVAHTGGPYTYTCFECHAGNVHANGNFQQVFIAKTGIIASTGGAVPAYNTTGLGTCTATYCHSNGAPRNGSLVSKPVSWADGKGTIVGASSECVACHDGADSLNTNSHRKHVNNNLATGKGYTCNICHAATAGSNTTIANTAAHVNGVKDISFSAQAAGSTWNNTTATCITYCHSNGGNLALRVYFSPDWTKTASGACGTCHAATPNITGGSIINSNGHFAHFSSNANSYGPMLSQVNVSGCQSCHTSYTNEFGPSHVDGAIQVTSTCTPCHNQAAKYVWTAGQVSCESCHTGALSQINGITAPDKSQFISLGHGKYSGKSDQCLNCHVRNDQHINANPASHATRLGSSYQGIDQNILCANCHNNPAIVATAKRQNMATHVLAKGSTPPPSMCSACHDVHGTTNLNSIYTKITYKPLSTATIVFTNTSTGYVNTKTNRGICQICHTQTNHFKRDVVEAGHPTKRCLACHDHKDTYAFKPNGNCNTCHGYPPVASMVGRGTHNNYSSASPEVINGGGYVNGGGAHAVAAHVSPAAQWGQTWDNCATCHDPNKHFMMMPLQQKDINVTLDPKYWTTNTIPATYTGPLNGTGTGAQTTGSCSNLYCHSNGNGAAPTNTTFTWSSPQGTLGCTGCHGNNAASTTPITTGKHSAHISTSLGAGNAFACKDCHAKTVDSDTHISNSLNHVNRLKDYSGARAGGSNNYNNTTKQCSNIYCHSNGNRGALVYVNPPAWNSSATLGCNGCHGTSNSIGAPDYTNGGAGNGNANSHNAHTAGSANTSVCSDCHFLTASTTGGKLKDNSAHLNNTVNVNFNPAVAGANATYDPATGLCSNIACHGNGSAQWGSKAGCLACHSLSIGNRAAIGPQFSGNSHHIQGADLTGAQCYQCHWEANSDGSINRTYHHSSTPGAPVELVVYGAGTRPATYTVGTTAIPYTANGSRSEMAKINSHCIGCHSDQNKTTQPFGDGKTPSAYAWDATSIGAKFGDTGTTPWSKYSGNNVTPKNTVTKAFSAHGNAVSNKGGWDTTETWKDRMATANVLCFDCHNSHGSNVSGTTTSYASATTNGGILKDIVAGKGGYPITYKPAAGGSAADHNAYSAGAGLCFDCHMKGTASATPWGYNSTFGSTQQIMGFADTPYFGVGTFGRQLQFSYKATPNMGGHLGASSALSSPAAHAIGGLCTPCHDPHGVSPTLGTNKGYAVPMLKGTWVTSPYKEDVTTVDNKNYIATAAVGYTGDYEGPTRSQAIKDAQVAAMKSYKIDQNTFSTTAKMNAAVTGVTETDAQFAGLCLNCHAKQTLTDGANHTWKDKNRIHESVKGWKTANTTKQHNFTCSKCHAPHNASLPRLMVTNCLDSKHRGRTAFNANPITSANYKGTEGSGSGHMPGSYSAIVGEGGRTTVNNSFTCHENNDTTQQWNVLTPWGSIKAPVPVTEPSATCSTSCAVALQWNASENTGGGTVQYQVQVSSSSAFTTVNHTSGWISGTSWSVTLANGTWYWRVQARDSITTSKVSAWSSVGSFVLSKPAVPPPTTPVPIHETDSTCSGSCAIPLAWNPSTTTSGNAIQYSVRVSSSSSFSTINYSSGWITGTSWTPTLGSGTWYWQVQARDSVSTALVSSWSAFDTFTVSTSTGTPTAPVVISEPDGYCSSSSGCSIGLAWNPSTNPSGGSIQYLVQVSSSSSFSTIKYQSSWQTAANRSVTLARGTWYWRVEARDASATTSVSPWSSVDTFVLR